MGKFKTIVDQIEIGKELIPRFPSTRHITAKDYLDEGIWTGEEKIDGANLGFSILNNEIVLRNRDHVLRKGYLKDTPAKKQFLHAWNWASENKKKLIELNRILGQQTTIYGEWCYALHGVAYEALPDFFIAFDLYLPEKKKFLEVDRTRKLLDKVGFRLSPMIYGGKLDGDKLDALVDSPSYYSNEKREGIYLKKSIDGYVVDRVKMVRKDYVQGSRWNQKFIVRQPIRS